MPLKEIRDYIDRRNLALLKQLLEEEYKKVRAQQERLKRIEQVIRTKLSLVELSGRPEVSGLEGEVCQEESQEEYITKISRPVAK